MRKGGSIKLMVTFVVGLATALYLPGLGLAGSLEPSDPPGPTMKTLDQIPPTWDQILPAPDRFVLVMGGAGVLDKETGLVWEQSPYSSQTKDWSFAQLYCNRSSTGGRCGWRLPTVQELESLVDPTMFSLQGASTLPSGNPFSNVQVNQYMDTLYWSATVMPWGGTTSAWSVSFTSGKPLTSVGAVTNQNYVWCVRGGSGVDAQ